MPLVVRDLLGLPELLALLEMQASEVLKARLVRLETWEIQEMWVPTALLVLTVLLALVEL